MHGRPRVSSAIPVCDNEQNFNINFSTVLVAQWVRCWSLGHRVVRAEGSSPGKATYRIFFISAMIFISVLLGPMGFSDIVIFYSRPNSCYQQNLNCFDMPLIS